MVQYSIIIPAHNEENYITKTLDSLRSLSIPPAAGYEVIVVANGCSDRTEEAVHSHNREHGGKIQLLSLPLANASVARNAGALKASREILIFLDADTRVEADFLEAVQQGFTGDCAVASAKSYPNAPRFSFRLMLGFKNFYLSTGLYEGCSGVLICRKGDFHAVGGYSPELHVREHRKLILKLTEKGKEREQEQFRCLKTYVTTSMRRYEQWGIPKALLFWCRQWVKDRSQGLQESRYEAVR